MDEFQIKAKSQKKVESISDMKNFVESYPQFKVSLAFFAGIYPPLHNYDICFVL